MNGQTDGRTDGPYYNIPYAFSKKKSVGIRSMTCD